MMKNRFVTFDAFLYAIMVKDDILINKSCVELWIEKWYLQRIVSHLTVKIICCKNKFYFISYVIENSCDFYALSFLKRYKVLWDFGKHLVLLTCSWLKYLYIFFFYVCWVPWRINWMKNVVYITLLLKKSIFKSCNSCIKPRLLNPNILKHTRIIQTTCQQIFPNKNMVWQECFITL